MEILFRGKFKFLHYANFVKKKYLEYDPLVEVGELVV